MIEQIREIVQTNGATPSKKKGVFAREKPVNEREACLSRRKPTGLARIRADEAGQQLSFGEIRRAPGFGVSSGDREMGPGFGFRKETDGTDTGPHDGLIREHSALFGKDHTYQFDFGAIRGGLEAVATGAGWRFDCRLSPVGI